MNVFYKLISLILIISSFSCGTTKLTNYGRPLSFLSKQRVPRSSSSMPTDVSNHISNQKKIIAKKSNNGTFEINNNNVDQLVLSKPESKNSEINKPFVSRLLSKYPTNVVSEKTFKKIESLKSANKFSNKFNTSSSRSLSPANLNNDDISDLVLLLICLLFPPVAVWWRYDFREQFWIDLAFYLPMVLLSSASFAILPVLYAIYVCFLRKKGNTGDVRSSW